VRANSRATDGFAQVSAKNRHQEADHGCSEDDDASTVEQIPGLVLLQ
jgi:hypothetical protein